MARSWPDLCQALKPNTPIFLPPRSPELNPVENIWQYIRANWLSNRIFENYDAIIDAACEAWNKLLAVPKTIKSIGMRDWAHVGRCKWPLVSAPRAPFGLPGLQPLVRTARRGCQNLAEAR